jgi:hypothetical protein
MIHHDASMMVRSTRGEESMAGGSHLVPCALGSKFHPENNPVLDQGPKECPPGRGVSFAEYSAQDNPCSLQQICGLFQYHNQSELAKAGTTTRGGVQDACIESSLGLG